MPVVLGCLFMRFLDSLQFHWYPDIRNVLNPPRRVPHWASGRGERITTGFRPLGKQVIVGPNTLSILAKMAELLGTAFEPSLQTCSYRRKIELHGGECTRSWEAPRLPGAPRAA
ncbi:hypothetical protein C8Q70DRAFT_386658 [Cubamyces menziesii]|nr:hypothetical protein C8Q70DRAFT_386658 [Cubamyces menziesii]